jgi:hypothetical protein
MMMKRVFLIALIILCFAQLGFSKRVDITDARRIAISLMELEKERLQPALKTPTLVIAEFVWQHQNRDASYVFNFNGGGWAVIAADDRVVPILAYADRGTLEPGKGSPEFLWWMDGYMSQIVESIDAELPAGQETEYLWTQWLQGMPPLAKGAKGVGPLLQSTWDQGIYYNYLCPQDPDGPGGRVYSGCVATCMAQVMYYYRYPQQGIGFHDYYSDYGYLSADFENTTYDWDAMLNSICNNYNIPMALIQYHCGVAVEMMYSPSGSGAYMWDATQAVIDHFGYSPSSLLEHKDDFSDADWEIKVRTSLDAKQPLCYAGFGSGGGHAFVCDGYSATDHFHFNWGWSGYADGYFYLDNLNPSSTFTNGQQAIFNMVPASAYPYGCSGSRTLTTAVGTIEDGSGPIANYASNGDCYWLIDPTETIDRLKITFNRFETESQYDVLTIYDGPTTADSVLGIFSGSNLPANLESTGSQVLVRYTTNGSTQLNGWMLSWSSVYPDYCDYLTELTNTSGTFGDGSGVEDYVTSTLCRWRIEPPAATGIWIDFTAFDMEGTDFVSIYDEDDNFEAYRFSSGEVPGNVFIFGPRALVIFLTDNYGVADGFTANYSSSSSGLTEISGDLAVSVYPNPAQDVLNVAAVSKEMSGALKVSILSPNGTLVYSTQTLISSIGVPLKIDISGVAAGLYFVRLETEQGSTVTKFIIE